MPVFYHKKKKHLILTSFKVMYSSLAAQPDLVELFPGRKTFLRLGADLIGIRRLPKYQLVRHPYKRTISFYKDKFQQHPKQCLEQNFANFPGWQHCQRIFFPLLDISETHSPAKIAEMLQAVSLDDCVEMIGQVAWQDPHLWPQVRCTQVAYPRMSFNLLPDQVFKLENLDEQVLQSTLGLQPNIRKNKAAVEKKLELSEASKSTLQLLYAQDFVTYHYSPA